MPGGLLQLAATGQSNIILNGNPSKTFFNAVYKPYTQFGLQRFRVDFTGERNLSFDSATEFEFKVPRYGDLLWDSYIVVNMPDIWSPLYWSKSNEVSGNWVPFEFKWTNEVGLAMIKEVTIHSGGTILSRYSGEYMANAFHRDENNKLELLNRMVGNLPEMYDPASRFGFYPHAINNSKSVFPSDIPSPACFNGSCNASTFVHGIEPSIRGRKLYIPLMAWFCSSPKMALPLVALQYQEVFINVEFRPVKELYTILDVTSPSFIEGDKFECPAGDTGFDTNTVVYNNFSTPSGDTGPTGTFGFPVGVFQTRTFNQRSRKAPESSNPYEQIWRFIQPPPDMTDLGPSGDPIKSYPNKRMDWKTDIHIMSTYIFLNKEERQALAAKEHHILIKSQYEYEYPNSTGSKRVDVPSKDMVSSYMWRFRRSDAFKRNQWHNYQNYPFENVLPIDFVNNKPINIRMVTGDEANDDKIIEGSILSITNPTKPDKSYYNIYNLKASNCMTSKYIKNIMTDMGIICGQEYRENTLDAGIYSMVEKWSRTSGTAKDGLYCYNFCIDSNRNSYQPTGAQNTNKWRHVTFEFNTIQPPKNLCQGESNIQYICDSSNIIIGLRKNMWDLNEYNFDLRFFEERFNMIEIIGGRIGLMFAR